MQSPRTIFGYLKDLLSMTSKASVFSGAIFRHLPSNQRFARHRLLLILSSRIVTSSAAHTTSASSAKPMMLVPAGRSMRRKSSYMKFPTVLSIKSIQFFTSASHVEEHVGIVGNGCTLGPKSYSNSLRPNLCLAGPRIYRRTGLARNNTGSDTCAQYALPDQGPEGAGSWSRMTHHLGRARLTSASPPRGLEKPPLGDEALPMGCHRLF